MLYYKEVFDAVTLYMVEKKLETLKVVVFINVLSHFLTCKAISAFFTLNKRGHIVYFIIGILGGMALENFERLESYLL